VHLESLKLGERHIAVFAVAVLLAGAVVWSDNGTAAQKTDFSMTYIGSRMVYLGQGPKLYDLAEQKKLKSALLKDSEPLIYEHPPFEALLLSPLGALPYKAAYLLWGFVNISIWLGLPWLLRPYAPVPRDDLSYLGLWLFFAPLGVTLFQGQSSLVILLLYSIAFICLKRGHDFGAGLALGLALLKFQFVIPLVLIFVLRRKWKVIKGLVTMASALGVLSLVAVGWRGIIGYIHLLAGVATHPSNVSYGAAVDMATVQGFVHAMLGRTLKPFWVLLIVAGVSGFLICWTAWNWRRTDRIGGDQANDLMFGAAVAVSLVAGFHMFTHDLSPLILAMLMVCGCLAKNQGTLGFILGGCLIAFWIPPVYFILLASHRMYFLVPVLVLFIFGTTRLAAILAPDRRFPGGSPGFEQLQKASQV
jgi:Glycosyltransferase family 87